MGALLLIAKLLGFNVKDLKDKGEELIKKQIQQKLKAKAEKVTPQIIKSLTKDNVTIGTTDESKTIFIRRTMLRLWKKVVSSGTVADGFRDAYDDDVIKEVLPKLTETTTLEEGVKMVVDAQVALLGKV